MRRTHRLPKRLIRWTGFAISFSLITSSVVTPATTSGAKSPIRVAQGQRHLISQGERQPVPKDKGKRVAAKPPEAGRPSALLPNLDEARQRKNDKPKAPRAIESTVRSRRKPIESRNGRKVGDPLPPKQKASTDSSATDSERVVSDDARVYGMAVRRGHTLTAPSLSVAHQTNVASVNLLRIASLRGLANHPAFDFLRYPILHSDTQGRSISEVHGNLGRKSYASSSLPSGVKLESFDLFTSMMPQSGGSKIVYASNREGSMQIYVMNGDGSGVTRLTYSGANDDFPRWSPNGTKILFQSDRDHPDTGYMDIYVMNSDGSGVARLTTDANDDSMASWSPDGSKIGFQSMRNGVNYQVYSMNADGSNQVCLTNTSSSDGEPSWSPDGSKIVFASDRDHAGYDSVYVMNTNGGSQQRLTFSASTVDDTQPAWSPNGSKIVFVSTRDSTTETWQETDDDGNYITRSKVHLNKEVYVMNSDGSGQTRLTNDLANDDTPSWSPDGTKIVWRSDRERDCCDPSAQVWTMNADGTGQADVSNNGIGDYTASWASGNVNQLPVANAGGSYSGIIAQNVPFNGGSSYDPDGSVVSYSWSFGDGGMASGVAPTHAYTAAGSYTVTLTVTDNLGAHGSASTTISVSSSSSDQFAQTFLQWGLGRSPNGNESTYWTDIMRSAYAQGQTSMLLATTEFGMTVFESAEYAGRGRTNSQYVSDLYHTYLMREPEVCQPNDLTCGPNYWASVCDSIGRESVRNAFETSNEFYNIVANLAASGSESSAVASLSTSRVDLFNQSGDQMRARDCEWNVPLVSLPGRAGLDLGLNLSYSSLVWTQSGPYIYFDQDNESISPGFTIGFPTVQGRSFDAKTSRNVYLLKAGGQRVELRQVGTSNVYEAADSSYLQLIDYGGSLLLRTTDGTQIGFDGPPSLEGWKATQIKDRNGNILTINNDWRGDIQSITDTTGRLITFNYDGNNNLNTITQTWTVNGAAQTHTWASFGWSTTPIYPSFGSEVVGAHSGEQVLVLTMVGRHDGTYDKFSYNGFGQVERITHYASDSNPASDNHPLNYAAYTYGSPDRDAPRITAARVWGEGWSDQNNVPHEVVTSFEDLGSGWHRMTSPDGTQYTEQYQLTGYQRGLVTTSEVWGKDDPSSQSSQFKKQKWTTINWTQENPSLPYQLNPRVIETNIYDAANNHRRTTTDYSAAAYAQYGLPYFVSEYAADGPEIRRTYTDYNLSQAYLDRRIIGLVSARHVLDVSAGQWKAKTTYDYDDPARLLSQATAAPGHDQSYDASFTPRGNVTSVSRWDVNDIGNNNKALTSYITYDAAGNALSITDPVGHTNSAAYADNFSDVINNARGTFAYPTLLIDGDNKSSYLQYNFDFGSQTFSQGPPPLGQQTGIVQTFAYDGAARLLQMTTTNTGAYTRYIYGPTYVQNFSAVNNIADDAYSVQVFDGFGRVFEAANYHPGSAGGYSAVFSIYDQMGRAVKRSNPTEINGNWVPYGDDAAGRVYTEHTYDWKGRPLVTTHPDGWQQIVSYGGCGCAGGEVTTTTDEAGRSKRTTADVLGRMSKTEELNYDSSVYSTANYTYNSLDQISSINHEGQIRSFAYDGYGRLQTRITPEQGTTTYSYNPDDTTNSSLDARGVTSAFTYNGRHQVKTISYAIPSGVSSTPDVTFDYDAAGNRTSMTDSAVGAATYSYDSLSRMTSETRTFPVGSYSLNYSYNYAGQLTGITNPWNASVGYDYDSSGRLANVNGAGYAGVTSYASGINYRAFGAIKSATFGDHQSLLTTYDNRMRPTSSNVSNVLGYNYNYYEHTGRVNYAQSIYDGTLDRSYEYDQVAALIFAHSGSEARAVWGLGPWGNSDGPYSHMYDYDKQGNLTRRFGWGGEVQGGAPYGGDTDIYYTYSNGKNQRDGFTYDAAGNVTNDVAQTYSYDANGQQATASASGYSLFQVYDGESLRISKVENGVTTYYLRSSVLGGAAVAEIDASGNWSRGYVYAGGDVIAIQQGGVYWSHEDAVTKSKRITDANGNPVSTVELDPWGADTNRSTNSAFLPPNFTSYIRDANGGQDAMSRRYSVGGRFAQPDPYGGSYDFSDPQSLNRYAYTKNDPVNFKDPSGMMPVICGLHETSDGGIDPIYCSDGTSDLLFVLNSRFTGFTGGGGGGGGQKPKKNTTPLKPPSTPYEQQKKALNDCIDQAYKDFRSALNANGLNLTGKAVAGIKAALPNLDEIGATALGILGGVLGKEMLGPYTMGIGLLWGPTKGFRK
jgi:RHS repeat-associated protein